MAGVFGRLANLWRGFLSIWISDVEKAHPEIAYENAINSMVEKYSKLKRATFARRGLTVPVTCTGAMDGSVRLTVSSATKRKLRLSSATLDSSDARCYGPHTIKVTMKPSSALAKALARKGGPRSVKLSLAVQMRDWGKPATTVKRTITLKR